MSPVSLMKEPRRVGTDFTDLMRLNLCESVPVYL